MSFIHDEKLHQFGLPERLTPFTRKKLELKPGLM
jgi:hypothetical protein